MRTKILRKENDVQRIKKASIIAALCILLLASVLLQLVSPSSAYFLSLFDKLGVNSVKVELIFDRLNFADQDIINLGFQEVDDDGNEIPWGSEQNPYVISQKFHIQNLSVLQNSGFFKGRMQTDADGNEVPAQSYFLVCNPDGTPVAIDCEGMKIEPVGTTELPFTGVIKGAPLEGEATYKSYGVSTSTIANLVVEAKADTPDIGFFGYVGYYGKYDKNTATLTDGYASTIENLLLADVTVKSTKSLLDSIIATLEAWWEKWTTPAIDPDSGDEVELDHTHFDETRAETHHVGIIAGHAEFATIKNVSVYYSEDVAAFDLVSDDTGSITNYYSSTGLIGLLQYVNPVENEDGTLDGSGGVSDSQIIGEGEDGGGGEESGTLTGYFLAEFLFEEHEKYLTAQGIGTKDSYDVKEMLKEDGSQLFETVEMKERDGILDFTTETVTYYYFQDAVFTFAMSASSDDESSTDYVQKIWKDDETPKIYGTSSTDKLHFTDDPNSKPRYSYLLTAVESEDEIKDGGYYLLGSYDAVSETLYLYDPTSGTAGKMIGFAKDSEEIYSGTGDVVLSTTFFENSSYIKSINLIGTNSQYYNLAFRYDSSANMSIITPSNNDKLGLTADDGGFSYATPTLYYGDAAIRTSSSLLDSNVDAYFYNWEFSGGTNGLFAVYNKYRLRKGLIGATYTYGWAKLKHVDNALSMDAASSTENDIREEVAFTDENYFTLFKITANTIDSSGKVSCASGNYDLTPKNIIPTTKTDEGGNEVFDTLYDFDPSTHVLEYLGDGKYKLAPIRSYKLNNGKGDLLSKLNHITRLSKATADNYSLNLFDEDSFLSFINTNSGGVVGASIGTNGTYATIPAGMIAFEIAKASSDDPSFINIIVAVNPEQTGDGTVGLWFYDSGATVDNFSLSTPNTGQYFALPISKTASSWENDSGYILNVTERVKEGESDGKKTYEVVLDANGNQESSYVYLGGEYTFVYHQFTVEEPGIYFIGAKGGPLSVSYFSVSGAAGAGSDGMTGSPLGMIDFVYDFNGNIITVDKLYTDEQFVSNENYDQYYPSFLFVSMLPEKEGDTVNRIQREQIKLRRYIDGTDTSGTLRHMKMTGENLTTLRGVSEILQDLQDDIDDD